MSEFQLIRKIQQETSVDTCAGFDSGVRLGIGDDAAVLELPAGQHLVAATDTLNEGVHFPVNTAPSDIGYKCLAVNLSDMAAMGAKPLWALLSLSLPGADASWVRSFSQGFKSLASAYNVSLVGGDTTSGPLSISVTALGAIAPGAQLTRSGARPGDLVVVSGTIGGAARVLELIQSGQPVEDMSLLTRPHPRVELGQALVGYASACIDISDGLLADIGHVLRSSGCGARIDVAQLPQASILDDLEEQVKWDCQLSGGDDYELLFTLPPSHAKKITGWAQSLDVNLSVIGEIETKQGVRCVGPDGVRYDPKKAGFEHFSQGE